MIIEFLFVVLLILLIGFATVIILLISDCIVELVTGISFVGEFIDYLNRNLFGGMYEKDSSRL